VQLKRNGSAVRGVISIMLVIEKKKIKKIENLFFMSFTPVIVIAMPVTQDVGDYSIRIGFFNPFINLSLEIPPQVKA